MQRLTQGNPVRLMALAAMLLLPTLPIISATGAEAAQSATASSQVRNALDLIAAGKPEDAYVAARGFSNPIERRAVQWSAIYYGEGRIDYQSVLRFAADAPDFAVGSTYRTRLEQAITREMPAYAEVIRVLGGHMPKTFDAQIALAGAYLADGQKERAARITRDIWVNEYLDLGREQLLMQKLGSLLTREDHWQRAVHLLMHDRATAAERLYEYLSAAQKSLAVARAAVARKQSNADALLDKVDPSLRDHYLFYFSRGQRAHDRGRLSEAIDRLGDAKGNFPDSAEFWYERRTIVRQALAADQYQTAYNAAATYTDGPEGRVVEAHFHAGWVALKYLGDAKTAVSHFEKMRTYSTLPESVTQANYWLGRALDETGDRIGAKAAYGIASEFGTLYYGQLAREKLGTHDVGLRSLPSWQASEAGFERQDLVKAVRLLSAAGHNEYADPLVSILAQSTREPGELLLTARLAQSINAHNVAILVADIADKRGAPLDLFSFPKDGLPTDAKLAAMDPAAIYAIARQESRFNTDAVSRSGALGLMQLMPATAREAAKFAGLAYSEAKLQTDPAYNAILGSTYLARQLDRFDGSLVLAAVAYNAGAGTANKWIDQFGDPRSERIDPVSWIERIPFLETRKYVQRVLGNYMVYRARLGVETIPMSTALRQIPH